LHHIHLDEHDEVRMTRRARKNNKSKKRKQRPIESVYKYGVEVPKNMAHARRIDAANNNTHWQDAAKREVKALMDLDCYEFHDNGHHKKLDGSWQRTTLHMIFDVKQDLTMKARLVAGGHLVDTMDIQVFSSTVKSISIQLLHIISHKDQLGQLCGDIGHATLTKKFMYHVQDWNLEKKKGNV